MKCAKEVVFRHRTVRLPFNSVGRRSMPPTPVQRCCTVQWRTCTECEFFDCKQNHSRATRYMISTFAFCPFFPPPLSFLTRHCGTCARAPPRTYCNVSLHNNPHTLDGMYSNECTVTVLLLEEEEKSGKKKGQE